MSVVVVFTGRTISMQVDAAQGGNSLAVGLGAGLADAALRELFVDT